MPLRRLAVLLLTLALVAAACGGDDDTAADDETTSSTAATTTTAPPETTTTVPETTTSTVAETTTTTAAETTTTTSPATGTDPDSFNLSDLDLGDTVSIFDALGVDSFSQSIVANFSGELITSDPDFADFGELFGADAAELLMDATFTRDPAASQVDVTIGDLALGTVVIGDQAWISLGGGSWISTDATGADSFGDITSAIPFTEFVDDDETTQATLVGTEEVAGRPADHYRLDQATLEQLAAEQDEDLELEINELEVDIWVDQDSGTLLRMAMIMDGTGFDEERPDQQGRIEMDYELYDLDAPITIEPPV